MKLIVRSLPSARQACCTGAAHFTVRHFSASLRRLDEKKSISSALASTKPQDNSLLAPVHIPEDGSAVIKSSHPSTTILAQSGLVVQRQIEMMNIFLGFEQANRYVILNPQGETIGFMAEHDGGFGKVMGRQWFRTHRAFTTHVFDKHQKEVLRVSFLTSKLEYH